MRTLAYFISISGKSVDKVPTLMYQTLNSHLVFFFIEIDYVSHMNNIE